LLRSVNLHLGTVYKVYNFIEQQQQQQQQQQYEQQHEQQLTAASVIESNIVTEALLV